MAIIKCPECGHQINENEKICPVCGVEIAGHVVKCHVCGEVYFTDEALCPNCHSTQYNILGIDGNDSEKEKDFISEEASTEAQKPQPPTSTQQHEKEPVEEGQTNEKPLVKLPEDNLPKVEPEKEEKDKDKKEDAGSASAENEKTITVPTTDDSDAEPDEPVFPPYAPTSDDLEEDNETNADSRSNLKRNVISFVVSIAVALLVAAISIYYYQETKVTKENKDYERAIANNDTTMMLLFLNTYADASKAHVDTIRNRIDQIRNEEKALTEALGKRDKKSMLHYLSQHPSSKYRQKILLIVDTLDWDSTVKVNSRQAYQDYLTAHADGKFADLAKDKLRDKELETTQADRDKMVNLFHDFFISVNAADQEGMKRNLSGKIDRFMGTEGATTSQVVAWMQRQHGEGVSKVIWRMNRDYKIRKREVSGMVRYNVDFTAQRDIVNQNGKSQTEHFRITTGVTGDGKISSMDMSTYTPQAKPATSSNSSSTASSSKPSEKPKTSSTTAKPAEKPKSSTSTTTDKAKK